MKRFHEVYKVVPKENDFLKSVENNRYYYYYE